MPNRLLWILSLVFITWMIWAETSFQFFEHDLASSLALDPRSVALVGAAFLVPYGLMQIPVGWLLDHGQTERLLLLGGAAAASFTLVFSLGSSIAELLISRAGMGLACAVAFPASGLLARRCLPPERFSLAMGFTDSLLGVGAALAALMPMLIGLKDWRLVATVQTGVISVVVVALVAVLLLDRQRNATAAAATADTPAPAALQRKHPNQLLQGALIYAWGGGLLFGLGQYALISQLRGWSGELQLQATLLLSLAISLSMVSCGALAQQRRRRWPLLLFASSLVTMCLLLLSTPAHGHGGVQLLAGAGLGLGIGSSVMAFPIAEEAAPPGRTALVVALVNTCGTVTGGFMQLISGQLLQLDGPGNVTWTLMVYGLLSAAGIPLALWVRNSDASTRARPSVVPSKVL